MTLRRLIPAFLLLASCSDIPDLEKEQSISSDDISVSVQKQTEIRVLFSEELAQELEAALEVGTLQTKSSALNGVFEGLGITSASRVFPYAGEFEERTRREGLHRWYTVTYDQDVTLTKAQSSFAAVPGVEIVESVPDTKKTDFNDLTSRLWGLYNTSYPGIDINVRPVWNNYTVGASNVNVAVLDEGIQLDHEDLADNCSKDTYYNFCDDNRVITPDDHGCHVAGTIAGVSNNGKGIAGIAGGDAQNGRPGVKLISCQVFKNLSDGTVKQGNKATAMKWAADNGAVISQNSWGYNFDYNQDGQISGEESTDFENATIRASDKAAVDYFIKYAGCDNDGKQLPDSPMKGGVVIFASGNDGFKNGAPANYPPIVAVGAISKDGSRAYFSNYGDWVDICAPGVDIYSTVSGNAYGTMSGTSMACPHVSGVAALIVSYCGGPGFTNELLVEKLIGGANRDKVNPGYKIGPLVDAMGAIAYGSNVVPEPVSKINAVSRSNYIDLEWNASVDNEGKPAYGYYIFSSTDRTALENATVTEHSGVNIEVFNPAEKGGDNLSYTLSGLDFEKEYHIKVMAYSYNMACSASSSVVSVATKPNNLPVITLDKEATFTMKSDDVVTLNVVFSEPDGHKLTVSHEPASPAEKFADNFDGRWILTITAKLAEPGAYTSRIIATDEYGAAGVVEICYEILPNRAPECVKPLEDVLMKPGSEVILDMSSYFTDPDGEQLKYICTSSDQKIIHVSSKGNNVYLTAIGKGSAEISISATDAKGEKVTSIAKVAIKSADSPLDIYPNPVVDYMNVSTMDLAETTIRIVSSTGKQVYSDIQNVSAFEPARIDLSDCAPGVYNVSVSFGGNTYKRTVVKL